MSYFFRKLGKMLQNLSSASFMIGALRVRISSMTDSNITLDKTVTLFSIKKVDIFLISQINLLWHSLDTFWHILI